MDSRGLMEVLLILPLVLHTASASAYVLLPSRGLPEQCLHGPEAWCESKESAFLCMKEKHCAELWRNSPAEVFNSGPEDDKKVVESPPEEEQRRWWSGRSNRNRKRKSGGGFKCTTCKIFLKSLLSKIDDNKSDEEISDVLDTICDKAMRFVRGICRNVVSHFKDKIIESIKESSDPDTICEQIKLCKSALEEAEEELDSLELPEQCLQGPEFWCRNEETSSLCMKEDYCTELQLNSPLELEASGQGEQEDSLEKKKKKKKDKKKKNKDKKGKKGKCKKKKNNKDKCSACTQIVQNLQEAAGEDPDEDSINAALDSMCDGVHVSISAECTNMQENNKDALTDAIKNSANAKDVCTDIGMCDAGDLGDSQGPIVPDPATTRTCTMCQVFTSLMKPKLIDWPLEKDLEPVLAEACQEHFGNSTTCQDFLSSFGAKMKHVLPKPWDHITTCLEIKACEVGAQPAAAGPGEANRCQEGPAYWCQSVERALQCNTLSYCIKAWRI